jgi:GTPase Era involved in 16S rRNA processing
MTRGDIFIQILSELADEPKENIAEMLDVIKVEMPPEQHIFDEEISDTEAEQLIDELMQEKEALLNWFLEGYRRFLLRTRTRQCDV